MGTPPHQGGPPPSMETLGLLMGQVGQGPLGDLGELGLPGEQGGKGQSLGEKREVSSLTWGLSPGPETTGGPTRRLLVWG